MLVQLPQDFVKRLDIEDLELDQAGPGSEEDITDGELEDLPDEEKEDAVDQVVGANDIAQAKYLDNMNDDFDPNVQALHAAVAGMAQVKSRKMGRRM